MNKVETKQRWVRRGAIGVGLLVAGAAGALGWAGSVDGPTASRHPTQPADLGAPSSLEKLENVIDAPGPIDVETVVAADWAVPRAGLINLEHPEAQDAGLVDAIEPIQIYLHAIRHPKHGLFIVDTGVERALRDDPGNAAIRGLVATVMHTDEMGFVNTTADWLEAQPAALSGVFLTHLHLDHISGLPDVPRGTPIYAGPGETQARLWTNIFVAPVIETALEGHEPLSEWRFENTDVVDVFGDQSVFAIHVPGHTPGSTAYLARTSDGPVLMAGDASHTSWGWDRGVEPGEYSLDQAESVKSLALLRGLAQRHPGLDVRLGHQPHEAGARYEGARASSSQ